MKATAEIKNSGVRAGDEVVQLYLYQRSGTSARPMRELKGFQRIHLNAGETRKVSFDITPAQLRYWTAAAKGWVIDEAAFDVAIGTDSTATFSVNFIVEP